MTPKPFLSKEDTNDDDYFYEIPRHVTHLDDNACERLKNITGLYSEMVMPYWITIPFNTLQI